MSLSSFSKSSLLRLYPSISDPSVVSNCSPSSLTIAHLNIRSLFGKIDLISTSKLSNFDVCMFSESWLSSDTADNLISLDNFQTFRKDRVSGPGGGIVIYVKSNISAIPLYNLSIDEAESLFLKVPLSPSVPPLILACVYRPPSSNISNFCTSLINTVDTLSPSSSLILLGDFNINLLSDNHSSNNFKATLSALQISCLNSLPTRITDCNESLLDLILTNNPSVHKKSVTYFEDLSDHLIISTFLSLNPKRQPKTLIHKRSFKNFSPDSFFNY